MGARLSLVAAGVAVYAGVVDVSGLAKYTDAAVIVLLAGTAVVLGFGLLVLLLASQYKKMIASERANGVQSDPPGAPHEMYISRGALTSTVWCEHETPWFSTQGES